MTDELRIRELLEEILDSGRSPDEVCAKFPNLLPEVRKRWRRIQRVVRALDELFPPSLEEGEGE
jgi:serine/threonine-protein kinase